MGIEKMELVNIAGLLTDLDDVLLRCCQSGCFHIEPASTSDNDSHGLRMLNEQNPYLPILKDYISLASDLGIKLQKTDFSKLAFEENEDYIQFVEEASRKYIELNDERQDCKSIISEKENALKQLKHLQGMGANFEQIFACEHVKVRIGRMPSDSYNKLSYYDDSMFFFVKMDMTKTYCWGMYLAPPDQIEVVDDIFKSLYFERMRIPDFVKGTPEIAFEALKNEVDEAKQRLAQLGEEIEKFASEKEEIIKSAFTKLKYKNDTFELRRMVAAVHGKFYLKGFVPANSSEKFVASFKDVPSVSVVVKPPTSDASVVPPTKLKNGIFSKPFGMLVEMYGLPSYTDINPTSFVAITYTILFGLMFGDLGQGFIIFLAGLIMSHVKKIQAGGILTRVGFSSMFFGFMYGSVFGFEHLLDPVHKALGWSGKPLEVFHQTTFILLGAVAIGVVLISISITMNIILGFRQKDFEKALFGSNGLAGLVLYDGVIIALALKMLLKINVLTAPYIILVIVLPLVCMFMRVPLANLITQRRFILSHDPDSKGIGNFIVENFFEMFEFLLSYVSNTMSFLRVGGFVLSHAGMMLVVMTLTESVSAGASPIVLIIGNLFVMGMEGMIVAIQVIRLEFYEIFSRFYNGEGKSFEPCKVSFSTELE